jgi:hypothetical protein
VVDIAHCSWRLPQRHLGRQRVLMPTIGRNEQVYQLPGVIILRQGNALHARTEITAASPWIWCKSGWFATVRPTCVRP